MYLDVFALSNRVFGCAVAEIRDEIETVARIIFMGKEVSFMDVYEATTMVQYHGRKVDEVL